MEGPAQQELFGGPPPPALRCRVELPDPEFPGSEYEGMLRSAGAVHCSNVHARMPPVDRQASARAPGPLLIRWMLRPGDDYESAGARFAPFSQLQEPDKLNRDRIAALVRQGFPAGDVHRCRGSSVVRTRRPRGRRQQRRGVSSVDAAGAKTIVTN